MQDSLLGSDSVTTCLKETSTQLGAISVQLFDYWRADIWFGWVRDLYDLIDRLYILFYLLMSLDAHRFTWLVIGAFIRTVTDGAAFQKLMDHVLLCSIWGSLCMMFRILIGSSREFGSMTDRDWSYLMEDHSCNTMYWCSFRSRFMVDSSDRYGRGLYSDTWSIKRCLCIPCLILDELRSDLRWFSFQKSW